MKPLWPLIFKMCKTSDLPDTFAKEISDTLHRNMQMVKTPIPFIFDFGQLYLSLRYMVKP